MCDARRRREAFVADTLNGCLRAPGGIIIRERAAKSPTVTRLVCAPDSHGPYAKFLSLGAEH